LFRFRAIFTEAKLDDGISMRIIVEGLEGENPMGLMTIKK